MWTTNNATTNHTKSVSQTTIDQFKVKSMGTHDKYFTVSRTDNGLVCSCSDNQFRKSDCKYIHVIFDIIKQNKDISIMSLKPWNEQN